MIIHFILFKRTSIRVFYSHASAGTVMGVLTLPYIDSVGLQTAAKAQPTPHSGAMVGWMALGGCLCEVDDGEGVLPPEMSYNLIIIFLGTFLVHIYSHFRASISLAEIASFRAK